MFKQTFLTHCLDTYNTTPDYPFDEDFETAVLRHSNNSKWYAIVMRVSRRKFGFDSDEIIDVVNLKLPLEMFGSFGAADGVYPAYHMNKLHWISVLLPDAADDLIEFLVNASYEMTKYKKKSRTSSRIPRDSYQKLNTICAGLLTPRVIYCVLPKIKGGTQYAEIIHNSIPKERLCCGIHRAEPLSLYEGGRT